MQFKGTPGEWVAKLSPYRGEIIVNDKTLVVGTETGGVAIVGQNDRDEVINNARLLAAAPELFAAAVKALEVLAEMHNAEVKAAEWYNDLMPEAMEIPPTPPVITQLEEALAKAQYGIIKKNM